ncbi:MAG: hypothetical protein AAB953_02675, partial [Patescibacteria group bacterium]
MAGFWLVCVVDKWFVIGPDRINNIGHFVHGSYKGDFVWLAFGSFLLKEPLKKVGAKNRDTGGVVKASTEYFIA